jgi:eukaryotic-like serine/threonine-protein kinase
MEHEDATLAERVGQTIAGRWTLRRLVGAGGMAAVYSADSTAGQLAAVKVLHPEMCMRREIRERFLREAAVMARIAHPGMVTIYEQGQSGDLTYLVMELLTGETAADRVRRLGRLVPTEVLVILDEVLDVLTLTHELGVVHRDLKPENLFLTQAGAVKVLDFGLARLLDAGPATFRTRTGAALGTLPYMAPEQALGLRDEVDARSDLFSLGATAFRLLTGRRIHNAPSEAELLMLMASQPAASLATAAPELAPDLALVVDRALAFAKNSRYPDARTMQSDVRSLREGSPPPYALERSRLDGLAAVNQPSSGQSTAKPNSTRSLAHAGPSNAEPRGSCPRSQSATAIDTVADPPQPDTVDAHHVRNAPTVIDSPRSQRAVPPTVAMAASRRAAPTVSERAQNIPALGASVPVVTISDPGIGRKRRHALIMVLGLLFGTIAAAAASTAYLVARQQSATPSATLPLAPSPASTDATQPRLSTSGAPASPAATHVPAAKAAPASVASRKHGSRRH